jgi:hypothetical protein
MRCITIRFLNPSNIETVERGGELRGIIFKDGRTSLFEAYLFFTREFSDHVPFLVRNAKFLVEL